MMPEAPRVYSAMRARRSRTAGSVCFFRTCGAWTVRADAFLPESARRGGGGVRGLRFFLATTREGSDLTFPKRPFRVPFAWSEGPSGEPDLAFLWAHAGRGGLAWAGGTSCS